MKTAVVMLSKSPSVDCCKTRMTNILTQRQANELQAAVIHDIFGSIVPEHGYDLWIAAPSPESLAYFHPMTSRLLIQQGNDLGEKMENLTINVFSRGYENVIVIGSDMPLMTSKLLTEAMHCMEKYDCVIGPAADGGYYLIGMHRRIPAIFSDIQWGTPEVLRQTIQALESASIRYEQLPIHRDIDDWLDLLYYKSAEFATRIPNTSRWLKQHCLLT